MNISANDAASLVRLSLKDSQPPQVFTIRRPPGALPLGMSPRPPWRSAAVLVPVVLRAVGEPTILLTERNERLLDHAGQVSFPGGSRSASDIDLVQTALRETEEETGLERSFVEVAGFLDGCLTVSGYAVTPVVGLVRPGFVLSPNAFEVAELFEVALSFLRNQNNCHIQERVIDGHTVSIYVFEYEHHVIWGATAAILVNLRDRLERAACV